MRAILDYTTNPKNATCPKCGKRCRLTVYVDGSSQSVHKVAISELMGVPVPQVLEACLTPTTQSAKESGARRLWLDIKSKTSKTMRSKKGAFDRAFAIEAEALYGILADRGYEWDDEGSKWRKAKPAA